MKPRGSVAQLLNLSDRTCSEGNWTVRVRLGRYLGLAAIIFTFLACAPGLATQPAAADAEYTFNDDFDTFNAVRWVASGYFAPDFGFSCGYWPEAETWLYIENTGGGVGDSAGQVGWKFYHTLPTPCSGMFSASFEVRWVETSDTQMDHVRLSLDDAAGDYQVNVGFEDSWALSGQRGMQAVISDVRTFVGGLPLSGRATLTVTRDAGSLVTVASDGEVFAQGVCTAEITSIGLWLYGCKYYPGVSCGVNYVSANFGSQTTSTGVPPFMSLFGLVVLGVVGATIFSAVSIRLYLARHTSGTGTLTKTQATRSNTFAGSSQPALAASGSVSSRCLLCGAPVYPGDRFCSRCGASLQA